MRSNTTPRPEFTTGEGLRTLLHRLRAGTPDAWAVDPEARALAEYTMMRYERLCRKWQRDPAEGATAAGSAEGLVDSGFFFTRPSRPLFSLWSRTRSV